MKNFTNTFLVVLGLGLSAVSFVEAADTITHRASLKEVAKRSVLKVDTIATVSEGGSRYNLQELTSMELGIQPYQSDDLTHEIAVQVLGYYLDSNGDPDGVFGEVGLYSLVHDAGLSPNGGTVVSADYSFDSDRSQSDSFWVLNVGTDGGLPKVNVKHFGALGDGSLADATAVKAAFDYVGSAGGGTVYFPAGKYQSPYTGEYFSDPVIMVHDNVSVVGDSRAAFASDYSSLEGGSVILGSFFIAASNFTIESIGIDSGEDYCVANNSGDPVEGFIAIDRENAGVTGFVGADETKYGFRMENVSILCHKTGKSGDASDVHALLLENFKGWTIRDVKQVKGGAGLVIKSSHGTMSDIWSRGSFKYAILNKSQSYADASYNAFSDIVIENLLNATPDPLTSSDYDTNGFVIEAADADATNITVTNIIGNGVVNGVQFDSSSTFKTRECSVVNGAFSLVDGYTVLFGNGDIENCSVSNIIGRGGNRGISFLSPTAENCAAFNCTMIDTLLYSYRNEAAANSTLAGCVSIDPLVAHSRIDAGSLNFSGGLQAIDAGGIDRIQDLGGTVLGLEPYYSETPSGLPYFQVGPNGGSMASGTYTSFGIKVRNSDGGAVDSGDSIGVELRAIQPGTSVNQAGLNILTRFSSTVQSKALELTKDGGTIQKAPASAETLGEDRDLHFYWVDNATVGVAMRGTDGVTRTGTIAVTP